MASRGLTNALQSLGKSHPSQKRWILTTSLDRLFDVSRTSTEIITEAAQEEGIMKKSQSLQYTLGKQKTSAGKAGKEFPESPGSLLPTLGEVNTRLKRHQLDSRKGSSI